MKTQILVAVFILFSTTSFLQNHNFNATTLVGVDIEEVDSLGHFVNDHHADVRCIWTANEDFTMLYYSEYIENGSILRSINFEILNRYEDSTVRHLVIKNHENIFAMVFWKDKTLVAYEFEDSALLFSGEIEY